MGDDLSPTLYSGERRGFLTQKPVALLKRIVEKGSNPGDIILDPFCGIGTMLVAAASLDRRWIGCEQSLKVTEIAVEGLKEKCGWVADRDFRVVDQDMLMIEEPPSPHSYAPLLTGLEHDLVGARFELDRKVSIFVLGTPIPIEETRHFEFKEVKGSNPAASIKSTADQYAVAFLNSEGGCIFWGVEDRTRNVVGVPLSYPDRDEIRRVVTERLLQIQPPIAPTSYRITIHSVWDQDRPVEDLVVVELTVPRVQSVDLFFTGKNEAFVKTDGGRRKLTGPEIQQEIRKRLARESQGRGPE